MEWYRKAAEHGYVRAQFSVGSMNEHGKGVDQNYSTKKNCIANQRSKAMLVLNIILE